MEQRSKKYYKDLDLIRVVACIAIFLYHLNLLKGGYLAVCTFFVLSGYLSCISSFKKEKFSLKEYYINRLLKIYVPLLVVVFVTISVISMMPNINFFNLKPETTSIIFGYNNFWQLSANLDYFVRHIDSPFMHLWYIAILLQFDLVFPFIYFIFRKIGDKFNKSVPCIITFILSIIFSIYFYLSALNGNIMVTYYNTFTRLFSVSFGICLGFIHSYYKPLIPQKLKDNSKIIFYIYILILILLFIFIDAKDILFPVSMILTTLISWRLIDYGIINTKDNLNKGDRLIKFIAGISYDIYLVQYPIIFFLQSINIEIYLKLPIIIILTSIISYLLHVSINFSNKNAKYKKLKYIVCLIILSITLFGICQYLVSPDYTKEMEKLEKQLTQNQEIMNQKQEEYEFKLKEEEANWLEKLKNIENNENEIKDIVGNLPIVGVGDSVMLGAIQKLYQTFPNGYFDSKTSRTAWEVNDILLSLKNKNMLGNPIILNLGANGDCPDSCKIEIIKTCEDRNIFWLNVTNDKDVHVNDKLLSLSNNYPNLHIIDWNSISANHPEYFIADGIHLTETGKEAYTKAIYDSIYQTYLDEYNSKKEEIIADYEEKQKNKITFYGNDILLYAFDYIQSNFSDSKFNINSQFNYEKLKLEIQQSINDNSMTKKIVLAFDSTINLNLEQYQDLINLCENCKIYIVATDEKTANNLYNINNNNVVIIDFYKEIKSNSNYLMLDKIHMTDDGNKEFSIILNDIIKNK